MGIGRALVVLALMPLAMVMWEDALERGLGLRKDQLVVERQGEAQQAKAVPLEWVDQLGATSLTTAGGDALRKVVTDLSGQPIAGIFIATDGANNAGLPGLAAANYAKQEGLPLFIYGVGVSEAKDIVVSNILRRRRCSPTMSCRSRCGCAAGGTRGRR